MFTIWSSGGWSHQKHSESYSQGRVLENIPVSEWHAKSRQIQQLLLWQDWKGSGSSLYSGRMVHLSGRISVQLNTAHLIGTLLFLSTLTCDELPYLLRDHLTWKCVCPYIQLIPTAAEKVGSSSARGIWTIGWTHYFVIQMQSIFYLFNPCICTYVLPCLVP